MLYEVITPSGLVYCPSRRSDSCCRSSAIFAAGLAGGHTPNYYSVAFPCADSRRLHNRVVRVLPESVALHARSGNALVRARLA